MTSTAFAMNRSAITERCGQKGVVLLVKEHRHFLSVLTTSKRKHSPSRPSCEECGMWQLQVLAATLGQVRLLDFFHIHVIAAHAMIVTWLLSHVRPLRLRGRDVGISKKGMTCDAQEPQ